MSEQLALLDTSMFAPSLTPRDFRRTTCGLVQSTERQTPFLSPTPHWTAVPVSGAVSHTDTHPFVVGEAVETAEQLGHAHFERLL